MSGKILLKRGPWDGLDVTKICEKEEHFFVLDQRFPTTPVLSYYSRESQTHFLHNPVIPAGVLGKITVVK